MSLTLFLPAFLLVGAGASAAPGEIREPVIDQDEVTEVTLKAVLIGKLVSYVDWPKERFEGRKDPLIVGVFGKDPFGELLDEACKKQVYKGRKIEIRRFPKGLESEGFEACHVLFIPAREVEHLPAVAKRLGGKSVMLVGDSTGFAIKGGALNFYRKDKNIAFEINPDAVKREKLKMSADLLKLARIVRDEKE